MLKALGRYGMPLYLERDAAVLCTRVRHGRRRQKLMSRTVSKVKDR